MHLYAIHSMRLYGSFVLLEKRSTKLCHGKSRTDVPTEKHMGVFSNAVVVVVGVAVTVAVAVAVAVVATTLYT